ncbi:MAG: ATP-binding cassette domain-containing protein, partial [Anaerovoracaceae bacterium]
MVRLENVNKYFNKRKKNEIHVINNTSINMESKGLIALLGPSGCGKTTLLN